MEHKEGWTKIPVRVITREKIVGKATKKETYDDYINRAIDALVEKELIKRAGKVLGKE